MKVFLARYPQYTNMCDKSSGACPLHYVAFSSQCLGQAEVMRTLLEAGAKPMVAIHHHAGWALSSRLRARRPTRTRPS